MSIFTMTLTAAQERKAIALLEREERKEAARVKLYSELRAKRQRWMSSKWGMLDTPSGMNSIQD